jgi:cytoskeleton protein RodZ
MAENDDEDDIIQTSPVGERLKAAREQKKLSLEDVADQTRIPLRHLQNLEAGEWSNLPAPTYTIGFAKSYASAVGLDRTEIGDDLRAEMGGQRFESGGISEVFEPADPARTMPRWLVLSTIGAIVLLLVIMTWLNNRSLEPDAAEAPEPEVAATAPAQGPPAASQPAPQPGQPASGPVVLTATEPAWIQVTDGGRTLFSGELAAGQSFTVPQDAAAPLLKAGKPEALRVTVGSATAPPVGTPGRVASDVSLAPADLMRGGTAASPPAPSAPPGIQNTAG